MMSKSTKGSSRQVGAKPTRNISGVGRSTFRVAAAIKSFAVPDVDVPFASVARGLKPIAKVAARQLGLTGKADHNGARKDANTSPELFRENRSYRRKKAAPLTIQTEKPVDEDDFDVVEREEPRECKLERPKSNRGDGSSRRFIPWDKKC